MGSGADEQTIAEEHFHGAEDVTSGGLDHEAHGKTEVAGGFAARGMNETDGAAIAENADGDIARIEEAFESGLGAGGPAAALFGNGFVEVGARGFEADEDEGFVFGIEEDEGGFEAVIAEVFEADGEFGGHGGSVGGAGDTFAGPAEEVGEEIGEMGDDGVEGGVVLGALDFGDVAGGFTGQVGEELKEALGELGEGGFVEMDLGANEGRGGDDEADLFFGEIAEPSAMGEEEIGVGGH